MASPKPTGLAHEPPDRDLTRPLDQSESDPKPPDRATLSPYPKPPDCDLLGGPKLLDGDP